MNTDKQTLALMQQIDSSADFWQDLRDQKRPTIGFNGQKIPRCLYRLAIARRDVERYVQSGDKPFRGWRISLESEYFGIDGGKQKVLDALDVMYDRFLGEIEN
tara:strand:+ start:242 stop:550 length:309 start_codon:yes stop_codon:yes gene_type:complete